MYGNVKCLCARPITDFIQIMIHSIVDFNILSLVLCALEEIHDEGKISSELYILIRIIPVSLCFI